MKKNQEQKRKRRIQEQTQMLIDEIKSMTMDEAKSELERRKKQKEDINCYFDFEYNSPAFESREFYLECKIRGDLK